MEKVNIRNPLEYIRTYLYIRDKKSRLVKLEPNPAQMNLYGIIKGGHYPNEHFWRMVGQMDVPVIIGFDAHKPSVLIDEALTKQGFAFAER